MDEQNSMANQMSSQEINFYNHVAIQKDWKFRIIVCHNFETSKDVQTVAANLMKAENVISEELDVKVEDMQMDFQSKVVKVFSKTKALFFRQQMFGIITNFKLSLLKEDVKQHVLIKVSYPLYGTNKKPFNYQGENTETQFVKLANGTIAKTCNSFYKVTTCSDEDLIKFFENKRLFEFAARVQERKDLREQSANHRDESTTGHGSASSKVSGLENDESHWKSISTFTTSTALEKADPIEVTEVMFEIPFWIFYTL
jgi:hypothetical protein